MRTRKNNQRSTDIWQDAAEVPRAGVPDAAKIEKRYRRVRRYYTAAGALLPVTLLVSTLAVGSILNADQAPPAVVEQADPATRNLAMSAVQTWLDSDPAPLPGASLLSWDDWSELPQRPKTTGVDADTTTRQSHTLTVRTGTGSLLTVQVLVALNPAGQAVTIGSPSVTAQLPAGEGMEGLEAWSAGSPDTASPAVTQAVEQWAAAYGSGDSVRLRQVVGDPDTTHLYVPLAGLSAPVTQVAKVAWRTEIVEGREQRTEYLMAQAVVSLGWDGVEREPGAPAPSATYDLLIVGADGGAPRVVAWGGPGTAPTLEPYANAVTGVSENLDTSVNPVQENS
ncbi:hypothetical protein [Pseudactinotalea terrae]|uniref:hypothetical protein n=1 Tax=Pseudactinotalea terrae TaxID=1743262 RepID=UPI0012E16E13|nr:hypothetical protein [Pseudactinotalea terrae]